MRNLKAVLFLFFAVCWSNVFAQPSFSLSQSNIACGEQTCLQVTAQDFTDILSFQYSMNWDAAILGNASVQTFGISDLGQPNFNLTTLGIARVGWDDSSLSGLTLAANTVLYEICFDEIGGNTATTSVGFSGNPIAIEVVDVQGQILAATFNDGTVSVDCGTMEGGDESTDNEGEGDTDTEGENMVTDLTFSASQATTNCGEQVCVAVSASGFTNVLSFQYSMNWDASLLGTATIQSFGIADMDASQFNATTPGILRVGYDDSSLQGVSLTDNSVLFQVCFDIAAGTTGNSDIAFSASPIPIEVADAQGNIIPVAFQSGGVTINCGDDGNTEMETDTTGTGSDMTDGNMDMDTTDNTNISDVLGFTIGQQTANCGDQVCMDVVANGFADISSFQYSLNWDADLLGVASVQSFGLPDLDGSQFNASTAGILRVGYDDSSLEGRSVADGTVLYQLCFDIEGNVEGTSAISFSNTPIAIEVVNTQSNIIEPTLQNGEIIVNCNDVIEPMDSMTMEVDTMTAIENELPLGFVIDSVRGNCGNQVCLDVRVQGFTDVTFFRYSLAWDFQVLGDQEIQQTNLDNIRFGPIAPGSFWTEWRSPTGQGVTIADNDVIYTVCFDALGESERATAVEFTNVPIPIQVTGVGNQNLRPNLENGEVVVTCNSEVIDGADSLAFVINDATGNCGEQTCVAVTAEGFNDILSFQYAINYNDALGTANVQNFGLAGMTENNFNTTTPGIIRVGWDDANLAGVDLADDVVLFDICFDAATDLAGGFEIDFSGTPIAIEVADVDGNIITPRLLGGTVNITCGTTPPVDTTGNTDNLQFSISDGNVSCGEQVCVDVTARDFTDILSFQYSINYDANVLGMATIQQFNLTGLGEGNFNAETGGIIRVGWTDPNVTGVTMAEDAVLYQICFDAIGDEPTSIAVEFSDNPLPSEILDGASNIVDTDFNSGNITMSCVGVEPPVDTLQNIGDELTFVLSKTSGDCADQVCMEVSVHNFTDVLSYQYSINWDAALGQARVQGFNMPDLGASNFNANTAGVLRVGWDDSFITGVSLTDGQIIYQICFDNVAQAVEDLPITFSGNPTSIEVVDDQSNLITPAFIDGSLTMTCGEDPGGETDGETTGDLTFAVANTTATCGEQMCTDITVKGFNDVLSFQYSIVWDAATLGRATVQNFGIPDINASNFNNNTAGILRVGWDDSFITGVSLPDDHVIFQVCFEPTSATINNAAIGFSGTPTSIEVADRDGQLLTPIFESGAISTNCEPVTLVDNDSDGFTNDVDCDDNNASINPNATEIANNGIDEDCDGADLITTEGVDNDGDGFNSDVDCDDNNPIVFPGATEYPNNNVDEDCDGIALFIDADNDGFNSSIDCDDNNAAINGRAVEIPNNGIDEDCDGADLITTEGVDNDGDGFNSDVDCDDNNPIVFPGATEYPNNNVDEDCDGIALFIDADNDGFNSSIDCDDNNAAINGRAVEIPNNGIDEDCDGEDLVTSVIIDADNDGFASDVDCDDNNASVNPGATEIANNGIDEDCNGEDLVTAIDADNDGFASDVDCDDNNADVNPNATEIANNGIDEDCNGEDLVTAIDADNDGFASDVDCDDNNADVNPSATEIANNGIDEDCSGEDLVTAIDADNDGFASDVDCDDNNADVNPSATEIANNGIDEDCSGEDLIEMDENAVTFSLSEETATCGSQVCFDAKVSNFNDLISFQYSLNWDSTKLGNVTTQNYTLEGLNASAFFTPQSGVMRVSWFDTRVVGVSIADDETIFQICFDVISNTSGSTNVEFSSTPIPVEIVSNEGAEVDANMVDGVVTISNCAGVLLSETSTPTMGKGENQSTISTEFAALKNNSTNTPLGNMQLYPNPTNDLLNIILEKPLQQVGTIRLYDIWGKLLQTTTLSKGQYQMNIQLGNYAKGVYLLEIQEGEVAVRKRVVKQ